MVALHSLIQLHWSGCGIVTEPDLACRKACTYEMPCLKPMVRWSTGCWLNKHVPAEHAKLDTEISWQDSREPQLDNQQGKPYHT